METNEGANNRHMVRLLALSILSIQRHGEPGLKIGRKHAQLASIRRAQ